MSQNQQIAIYVRVSTRRQDTRSQEPDLKRWLTDFEVETSFLLRNGFQEYVFRHP